MWKIKNKGHPIKIQICLIFERPTAIDSAIDPDKVNIWNVYYLEDTQLNKKSSIRAQGWCKQMISFVEMAKKFEIREISAEFGAV